LIKGGDGSVEIGIKTKALETSNMIQEAAALEVNHIIQEARHIGKTIA
jgi:hypothetical protein